MCRESFLLPLYLFLLVIFTPTPVSGHGGDNKEEKGATDRAQRATVCPRRPRTSQADPRRRPPLAWCLSGAHTRQRRRARSLRERYAAVTRSLRPLRASTELILGQKIFYAEMDRSRRADSNAPIPIKKFTRECIFSRRFRRCATRPSAPIVRALYVRVASASPSALELAGAV